MDSKVMIRPALTSDLPAIALLHIEAHPNHPMTHLAWSHPLDAYPIFLARYNLIISLPYYHFLVATSLPLSPVSLPISSEAEILGFVIWKDGYDINGGEERQEPEFKPEFPPTPNLGFMSSFQGQNAAHEKTLSIEGMGELELLDVRPSHQRKGVGALLLEAALKEFDKRGEKMYVKSSRVGKGLYERFGWMATPNGEEGEKGFKVELKEIGEEGYVSWDMMRDIEGGR